MTDAELYADFKWLSDKKQFKTFLNCLKDKYQSAITFILVDGQYTSEEKLRAYAVAARIYKEELEHIDNFIRTYEETKKENQNA